MNLGNWSFADKREEIPMGTNCAPLLADIFLYSYEAEFIQSLLSTGKKKISISVQLHIQIHR